MAISSKAAAFAALNPNNPTPHSHSLANVPMCFRPMSSKSEMGILVSAKGNLSSLRGGTGLLERPTFDQSQFDPSTEVQEGKFFFGVNRFLFWSYRRNCSYHGCPKSKRKTSKLSFGSFSQRFDGSFFVPSFSGLHWGNWVASKLDRFCYQDNK